MVKSSRPLSITQDDKLVEAFEIADPKLKVPTTAMVKKDVLDLYKDNKEKFIEEMKSVEFCSSTNDAGSSVDARSFVDINIHYVTEDFYLKKKILDVVEMKERKSAINYRKRVDEAEEEF